MHYLQRPVRSVVKPPHRSVVRSPLGGIEVGPLPVPAWTPDDVLAGVTNSFWTDPLASTLFEDVGLGTPATTGNPVGGVQNLSTIGTSTLSQASTGDKFKVAIDGRLERDGTTTTQRLLYGGGMETTNGFCFALDADMTSGSYAIGGDVNRLGIIRWSNDLLVRVGSTSFQTVAGIFAGGSRKRIIVAGDNAGYEIFVDGASFGSFTPGVRTTYSNVVTGTENSGGGTTPSSMVLGRMLIAEKDLRANATEIDAWLGA